jgi:hypothetical protein
LLCFGAEKWRIVAEHRRSFGRGETVYDPWHYVPMLARKPACSTALPPLRHRRDRQRELALQELRLSAVS